jgi:hypothetical protein
MDSKLGRTRKYFLRVLAVLVLLTLITYLTLQLINKKKSETEKQVEKEGITWEISIPENYNIAENKTFSTVYFSIYYSSISKKYYVDVTQGKEYDFEEIKAWISNKFDQFGDLSTVNSRNIEFNDLRFAADPPDHYLEE